MTPPPPERVNWAETRRRVSYRLQFLALVAVSWLLRLLGIDASSRLMGLAWRVFAPFNKRHARADAHLAAAFPEKSAEERRRILGDMWENLGRTAAETILLPQLLAEPERIAYDTSAAQLEQARGGAVFVSLHYGNWEVVAEPLRRAGLDLVAVYKPLRNPAAETWLLDRRRSLYAAGLLPLDRWTGIKLRTLARGGATLAVLGDLHDHLAIPVPFFGRLAGGNPFPATLARRLGLPLFVGRATRVGGARFRLDGHWVEVPKTDDEKADVLAATTAVHAAFEAWIREHPAQWMWAHRKWL
ncbi:MAG: lauroyl acyltransferase [Siculibacillus sp.]